MIKLMPAERKKLEKALLQNVEEGCSIVMDEKDTSFVGTSDEDAEVISAIRSVPCHY